jgi:hypothetical protein
MRLLDIIHTRFFLFLLNLILSNSLDFRIVIKFAKSKKEIFFTNTGMGRF